MTPQAVVLLMAGDATLQVLPGCLGVAQDPEGLSVVEGGDKAASALEAQVHVALAAESL